MQLKEHLNFNKQINLPEQVTADEQSTMCCFLGKCSDDPENSDWIPTFFTHKQARTKSEIIKVDQQRKRYKSICEKRAIISDASSSNSNKNEECGGGKVVLQIRTYSVIYTKMKLRNCRRNWLFTKLKWLKGMKRFISCVKKIIYLKPVNIHISILKNHMTKWNFLQDLIVPDWYGCSTKWKVLSKLLHKKWSLEDHMLVVIMKLGLLNKDLAVRFNISTCQKYSKINSINCSTYDQLNCVARSWDK